MCNRKQQKLLGDLGDLSCDKRPVRQDMHSLDTVIQGSYWSIYNKLKGKGYIDASSLVEIIATSKHKKSWTEVKKQQKYFSHIEFPFILTESL